MLRPLTSAAVRQWRSIHRVAARAAAASSSLMNVRRASVACVASAPGPRWSAFSSVLPSSFFSTATAAASSASDASSSSPAAHSERKFRLDYAPSPYTIDECQLDFRLHRTATRVSAEFTVRRNPLAAGGGGAAADLDLHGEQMELLSVSVDDRVLEPDVDYELTPKRLRIRAAALGAAAAGGDGTSVVRTSVLIDPTANTLLSGLYKAGPHLCTQCESHGFRRITYFLDRPDVLARFTTRVEGDRGDFPVLLSNGDCVEKGEAPDGAHFAVFKDPWPKPSYLFALVAGRLARTSGEYVTASGRRVALDLYVDKADLGKTAHAMRALRDSFAWDEREFGLEYDLDTYAVVAVKEFTMGAMENKGLNVFNAKYVLASPDTATDTDYQGIATVIAHEYFHNWTGNRVTCRDWFQLSLKEGLTVFRDQLFSAEYNAVDPACQRIADVAGLRAVQFGEDGGPMAHSVRPDSYISMDNFYTATVYRKGAEVCRMYHTLLGKEGFRAGMDLYFQRHDGQAVTCDDFRAAMADANGADLAQFERWYDQAGTPVLSVSEEYDADKQTLTLRVSQSLPLAEGKGVEWRPFHIPIRVGLLSSDGADMLPAATLASGGGGRADDDGRSCILELRETEGLFVFAGVSERPVVSFNRAFSAPVTVRYAREENDADLMHIMASDSDSFNRWDAWQQLARPAIVRAYHEAPPTTAATATKWGALKPLPPSFVDAWARCVADEALDPYFRAQMFSLPPVGDISDAALFPEGCDPAHVFRVQREAQVQMGQLPALNLLAMVKHHRQQAARADERGVQREAMGHRKLSNACLALACLGDGNKSKGPGSAMAETVLKVKGLNMTDTMAALGALVRIADRGGRDEAAEQALEAFRAKHQGDALVMDKWFAVQASSLRRVRALLAHPDYDEKTPNRVYALLGTFGASPEAFHTRAGYELMAQQVVRLDAINGMVASRLLDALVRRVRTVTAEQRAIIVDELRFIGGTAGLSDNCFEKVKAALEACGESLGE